MSDVKLGKYLVKEIPKDRMDLLPDIIAYMDKQDIVTIAFEEYIKIIK